MPRKKKSSSGQVVRVEYVPTPRQQLFHASQADEVLYGGAAGGGKSKASVMDAFFRCMAYPGTHAYMFRRTYNELRDTLINEARASIPLALGRYVESRKELNLINGSVIHFRHCQEDSDRFQYQGAEIHWLYIDELTHFSQVVYDFLKTRLRANKALGIRPVVRCTSNPGGVGHAWVKAYFVDAAPPGEIIEDRVWSEELKCERVTTRQYIPARATDNPHISSDYIYELEKKPKNLRDALLLGKWDAFEGQVFVEWRDNPDGYISRKNSHVIKPFPIPRTWLIYRSFDFGYTKPFSVGWWAVDHDGTIYRFAEWYGCDGTPNVGLKLTVPEIAKGIKEFESSHGLDGRVIGYGDPSMWDASRGQSVAEQFAREGVYFNPATNDRIAGKMQVHQRLAFDEHGYARLYVFSTCRDTIRTIPALCYDDKRVEDVDTDGEDHIYDDWRYVLMVDGIRSPISPQVRRKQFNPLDM